MACTLKDVPAHYTGIGNLKVHPKLVDLVERTICPGTGFSSDYFWKSLERLTVELRPEVLKCLAQRDELQAKIDRFYKEHKSKSADLTDAKYRPMCKSFLEQIGYLESDAGTASVATQFIDPELAAIPAPQLVVPSDNARYVLNAVNARWGSLFDALYGFDVIPQTSIQSGSGGGAGFAVASGASPSGGDNLARSGAQSGKNG